MSDSHLSMDSTEARSSGVARHIDAPVTVFPNRRRFEAGVERILRKGCGQCAVVHVTVLTSFPCIGALSRRLLNLVGNVLRAGMRSGAAAYLGNGEFAVLLQDTDVREAAAYARAVGDTLCDFRMAWEGETLYAKSRIGVVIAGECRDGTSLLESAMVASAASRDDSDCRLRIADGPELVISMPKESSTSLALH